MNPQQAPPRRYLGLDLGGTNIKSVVLEAEPGADRYHVVESDATPTRAEEGPDAVIDRVVTVGRTMAQRHGPVVAAGAGVPGLFDPGAGTMQLVPNLPGNWYGLPVRDRLADGLDTPVTVVNDARAGTLAEARMGAGRGSHTLICVMLGTGVGGGIAIRGRLHHGAWGAAGEIGHQIVQPDGRRCNCGNHGCLETVAQAAAIARLGDRATADAVFTGVRAGDPRCREAVDTVAAYLGIALANCVTMFGADRIVVGGGVATAGELLLDPVRRVVRERITLVPAGEVQVVPTALGENAGAIGAALAALPD